MQPTFRQYPLNTKGFISTLDENTHLLCLRNMTNNIGSIYLSFFAFSGVLIGHAKQERF